jgi:hypothetical protein
MPKYTTARIAEIRGHLADLERRGVSIPRFAREIGVAQWTVRTWVRRFGPARPASNGIGPIADLVEVAAAVGASAAIEIVVGAVTVRVPSQFDPDDLRRVLQAVQGC